MRYALPILLLIATVIGFFLAGRRGFAGFGRGQTLLRVLVAIPLLVSGIFLHFLRTGLLAGIVPPVFPASHLLVLLTGVCEIAGAVGLFIPTLRRAAALCLAILMIAVFPANVYAAGLTVGGLHMPSVPVRTAMQVVFMLLILLAGYGVPRKRQSPDSQF